MRRNELLILKIICQIKRFLKSNTNYFVNSDIKIHEQTLKYLTLCEIKK